MLCKIPVIWLKTRKDEKAVGDEDEEEDDDETNITYEYLCPVFKTSKRTSIISSSGRSDEHIISIVSIYLKYSYFYLYYIIDC